MCTSLKKRLVMTSAIAGVSALVGLNALAASQSITASVQFLTPLAIGSVVNANFGQVEAGAASTVYALDTAGAVSVTSGPGTILGGTPAAASISITGSASQTINIGAGGYTADSGVTPSAAVCKYGAGSEVACTDVSLDTAAAPTGSGTTLLMGLTITAASIADGTTATPSFTVTVVYN